jgi:hypothetical protein
MSTLSLLGINAYLQDVFVGAYSFQKRTPKSSKNEKTRTDLEEVYEIQMVEKTEMQRSNPIGNVHRHIPPIYTLGKNQ